MHVKVLADQIEGFRARASGSRNKPAAQVCAEADLGVGTRLGVYGVSIILPM